ncbi:MAG: metal-dependent hydrolase [Euryarchaeota archaeon]|nr:metal-dependent hydrolase [Euryarchaeota archaeon]
MFLFGHLGITLALFYILGYLVPGIRGRINYWYVALGSILPDIIDKPIGRVIFASSIANGYLIAHTLVFCLLLSLAGFYLYKRRGDARLFMVSGASSLHLLEDRLWEKPVNFFWPLFGWMFPPGKSEDWINYFLDMFRSSYVPGFSYVFISESLGSIIIMLFVLVYSFSRKKGKE